MIPPASPSVLDRADALKRAGGDEQLCQELAKIFRNDVPRLTQLLESAVARSSAKALRHAAHSLRGSASQVGACAVAERAGILEAMGKADDLHGAEGQLHLLQDELAQLSLEFTKDSDAAPSSPDNGVSPAESSS